MVDKIKVLVLAQTALIVMLLAFSFLRIHIFAPSANKYDLLALATRYDPEETRASVISFEPLRESMQAFLAENKLDGAIYVVNLRNGVSFGINENEGAFPASLNKVPVAILVMREVEKGRFKMNSMVPINSSILQSNSVEVYTNSDVVRMSSSSDDVYKNNKELPLRQLLENMLQKSDNNALRILSTQINKKDLLDFYSYVDVDAYGSYDYSASNVNNRRLSAKALANIFLSLYHSTILEPENSQYILSLLADTTFDARKIAQLPADVKVAHKFGIYNLSKKYLFRDCGIIYSDKSRILYCIVIRDQQNDAIAITGDLIKAIHSYVVNNEVTLDEYELGNHSRNV